MACKNIEKVFLFIDNSTTTPRNLQCNIFLNLGLDDENSRHSKFENTKLKKKNIARQVGLL